MKLPKSIMKLKTEGACLKAIDDCHARHKELSVSSKYKLDQAREIAKDGFGVAAGQRRAEGEKDAKRAAAQLKCSQKIGMRLAELRTIQIPEVERALTTQPPSARNEV